MRKDEHLFTKFRPIPRHYKIKNHTYRIMTTWLIVSKNDHLFLHKLSTV